MSRIICPNCRAVVQYTPYCSNCKLFLKALQDVEQEASVPLLMVDESSPEAEAMDEPGALDIDPVFQWYSAQLEQDVHKLQTASTRIDEVAVIAKVVDKYVDQFVKVVTSINGRIGLKIGPVPKEGKEGETSIMTARIPIDSAAEVRRAEVCRKPFVVSLKASSWLKSTLTRTVLDVKADSLPAVSSVDGGRGVIIGIVDIGMNFLHEKFRNDDGQGKDGKGSTRILSFWNQSATYDKKPGELGESGPFGYGRVFSREDIDAALQTDNPFEALKYNLIASNNERDGVHATAVADIAAGNDRGRVNQFGKGHPGIAPNADIVFVELSSSGIAGANPAQVIARSASAALEASFADSAQLLEAIKYIFDFAKAEGKPCVVNVSLGTNGGPHDGTSPVEEAIDRLVSEAPNRAVVIAAGNFADEQTHVSGTVTAKPHYLRWEVRQGDPTGNELEIWYSGDDVLQAEVITPYAQETVLLKGGQARMMQVTGDSKLFAVHRINDGSNKSNLINIFLEQGATPGIYTVRLTSTLNKNVDFHAWIERDHKGRSVFLDSSADVTLSSIACGKKTIVVGAYDAHTGNPAREVFPSSSFGPTRTGDLKPDISAPGVGIMAASFDGSVSPQTIKEDLRRNATAVFPVTGTSMASAVVSGVIALMLAEASEHKFNLNIDQIRDILIEASRPEDGSRQVWDKQLGHGRICASKAIELVVARAANLY